MERVLWCLLVLLPVTGNAQEPSVAERFLAGNQAYQDGRFEDAWNAYQGILESGITAPALEYNLGNAALKTNRLGWSVYHYREALRLEPGYENAQANLDFARALTKDVKPETGSGGLAWVGQLRLGPGPAARFLFVSVAAFFALGIIRILWWRDRASAAVLQGILGGAGLLILAALVFELAQDRRMEGVVIEPVTDVRAGPGEDYTVSFRLHDGTEVDLLRESAGWWELKVSDKLQGWIPEADLAVLP